MKEKKLLGEAEAVHRLLLCASVLIRKGLASCYPGLNALLVLKLRRMGIDPETGLATNTDDYVRALLELLGGEGPARSLLRGVLPGRRAFERVVEALLLSRSRAELENSLLSIIKDHGRELRSACKDVY